MTSAAFSASSGSDSSGSASSGSRRRISLRSRRTKPASATATAADDAIQQFIDRRRRRNRGDFEPDPPGSAVGEAVDLVSDAISGVTAQLGLPRRAMQTVAFIALAALLTWSVIGMRQPGPPVPVNPVLGRLQVGTQNPAGAQLVFHPVSGQLPDQAVPRATTRQDGSFVLSTFGMEDGAPKGEYIVTVQWFRIGKDGAGPNVLPSRYARADLSPLRVTVHEGHNDLPPLVINR